MNAPPLRTEPDLSMFFDHGGHVLRTKVAAALSEIGITARHQCVLLHALEQDRTQIQLAEVTYLDKTTMVVTLDDLERSGLVERRPSPTDRRARIVHVTEAGVEMARRGQRIVDGVHRRALDSLPPEQADVLVTALSALLEGFLNEPVETAEGVRRSRQPLRIGP